MAKMSLWLRLLLAVNPDVNLLVVECEEAGDQRTLERRVAVPPHKSLAHRAIRMVNVVIVRVTLIGAGGNEV